MAEPYPEPKFANEQMIREMGYTGPFGAGGANAWLDHTGNRAKYETRRAELGVQEGVQPVSDYVAIKAKAPPATTHEPAGRSIAAPHLPSLPMAIAEMSVPFVVGVGIQHAFSGRHSLLNRLQNDSAFAEKFCEGQFKHFHGTSATSIGEALKDTFKTAAGLLDNEKTWELREGGVGRWEGLRNAGAKQHLTALAFMAIPSVGLGVIKHLNQQSFANSVNSPATAPGAQR